MYDTFAALLVKKTEALRVGHGLDEGTTMGALTVPQGLEKTAAQVEDARAHAGAILTGGNRIHRDNGAGGYFFEPTIIANATAQMKIASEETFGPLLALFPFDTEEEAVTAANNTSVCFSFSFFFAFYHPIPSSLFLSSYPPSSLYLATSRRYLIVTFSLFKLTDEFLVIGRKMSGLTLT